MQNEERIAVLELQYRNMKRIVLGVAWVISLNFAICSLIIVGYFVSTTNAPDVIQAKRFEVLSDNGNAVVVLDSHILELEVPLKEELHYGCLLYTSPSPRDRTRSRMPSSA